MPDATEFTPVQGTNDAGYPFTFDPHKLAGATERLRAVVTGELKPHYTVSGKGVHLHTDLAMVLDWAFALREDRQNVINMLMLVICDPEMADAAAEFLEKFKA